MAVDGLGGVETAGREAMFSASELHRLAGGFGGDFAEGEVAERSFVEDAAGAVRGEALVGECLDAKRPGSLRDSGKRENVGVAFGLVAAGEDHAAGLDGEDRKVA